MKRLKLGRIALDGAKMAANASKHKALSRAHSNKIEAQLRQEVQALLAQAKRCDPAAIPACMDVPAEVVLRKDRIISIKQGNLADEESRMMPISHCSFEQRYKVQVGM